MSGAGQGKLVAVTGASGYIASWLVKLLLDRGYTVKASANLLEEGSFDALVDECEGVFHTASLVQFQVSDPQTQLLDPAIKGTLNVLRSCAKVQSIKRVVLTSSMAAVSFNQQLKADVVVDETSFSDPSYIEELKFWYGVSKTLAEDAAWKFAKEQGIDMVTVNPAYVIGPLLQPSVSLSTGMVLSLVNAFEVPTASGRYCVVGNSMHWSEVINILRELYPTLKLPEKSDDNLLLPLPNFKVSNEKAKSLGLKFTPLEVSLKDTIESFKEKNLVGF